MASESSAATYIVSYGRPPELGCRNGTCSAGEILTTNSNDEKTSHSYLLPLLLPAVSCLPLASASSKLPVDR